VCVSLLEDSIESGEEDGSDADSEIRDPPAKTIGNMETTRQEAFDSGCDSEGDEAPQNNTEAEETLLEDEMPLGSNPLAALANNDGTISENKEDDTPPPGIPVVIATGDLEKLNVSQIKEELQIRNVTYPGRLNKQVLAE
jgi:hypothetical protein